jgi:urea transport system permease protein
VFKSRDAALLATVDTALAKESDYRIKRALGEARAAILLYKPDASEVQKLEAVATLRARGDPGGARHPCPGLPADSPARVAQSAQGRRRRDPERSCDVGDGAECLVRAFARARCCCLAAIGLAITFGVMGVINMAHGEMVMIGAYVTFAVQEAIRTYNPALFDYSLLIAVPSAFLVTGLLGIFIERSIIRFLYGRPARDLARDLGFVAHPAAGGAHRLRSDQPRSRQSVLDERRLRGRADHHHL